MRQPRATSAQHLAARWWWQAAPREDSRVARRLSQQRVVEGVYRLDAGARLDACCHCMRELGGVDLLARLQGPAMQRAMVPVVQDLLR